MNFEQFFHALGPYLSVVVNARLIESGSARPIFERVTKPSSPLDPSVLMRCKCPFWITLLMLKSRHHHSRRAGKLLLLHR